MPEAQPQAPAAPAQQPPAAPPPAPAAPAAPAPAPAPKPAAPAAPPTAPAAAPAQAPAAQPAPAAPPPAGPERGPDGKFVAKPAETPKAPDTAPAPEPTPDLEIALPGADPKVVDSYKAVAKEIGLNSKQAQALADWQVKLIAEQQQLDRVSDLDELKADPKHGGALYDRTREAARRVLANVPYGPELSKQLVQYGLDCKPTVVKFLAAVGELFGEDNAAGRLTSVTPEVPQRPMTQTERVAATYKSNKK